MQKLTVCHSSLCFYHPMGKAAKIESILIVLEDEIQPLLPLLQYKTLPPVFLWVLLQSFLHEDTL